MKLSLALSAIGLFVFGCSPPPESAEHAEPRIEGVYARVEGDTGDIAWIAFEDGNQYALSRETSAAFEVGTYVFDSDRSSVTLRSASGEETTMPLTLPKASEPLLRTQAIFTPSEALVGRVAEIVVGQTRLEIQQVKLIVRCVPGDMTRAANCASNMGTNGCLITQTACLGPEPTRPGQPRPAPQQPPARRR